MSDRQNRFRQVVQRRQGTAVPENGGARTCSCTSTAGRRLPVAAGRPERCRSGRTRARRATGLKSDQVSPERACTLTLSENPQKNIAGTDPTGLITP